MVGANSNIYVSITGPQSGEHHEGYRRPQHIWLISIEPHHTHVPGTSRKEQEPIHYSATKNPETGIYTLKLYELSDGPGIIGNILVAESAHVSPEKFRVVLEEELGPKSPVSHAKDHEPSDDEAEHWIRRAVHGLQQRRLAESFQIDDFMRFAHGYLAERMEDEAPALITYPKAHRDHEKKSSKHRFWISHPMSNRTKTNNNGEARIYGGLM